jgi:hypothetical protein
MVARDFPVADRLITLNRLLKKLKFNQESRHFVEGSSLPFSFRSSVTLLGFPDVLFKHKATPKTVITSQKTLERSDHSRTPSQESASGLCSKPIQSTPSSPDFVRVFLSLCRLYQRTIYRVSQEERTILREGVP